MYTVQYNNVHIIINNNKRKLNTVDFYLGILQLFNYLILIYDKNHQYQCHKSVSYFECLFRGFSIYK